VVWRNGRIDFGERLTARRSCPGLACEHPATLMAFDVLRVHGVDLTGHPLHVRRAVLEKLARTGARRCR
jgi:bifunctional non-homologous end joining protein LigD